MQYFLDFIKPVSSRGLLINKGLSANNVSFKDRKIPSYSVDPISGRVSEIGDEYVTMTTHKNGGRVTRWQHKRQPDGDITISVPVPKQVEKLKEVHQCDGMYYRVFLDTPEVEAIGNKYKFTNLPSIY